MTFLYEHTTNAFKYSVFTDLENLELSGNFEKSKSQGNSQGNLSEVREFKLKSGNFQLRAGCCILCKYFCIQESKIQSYFSFGSVLEGHHLFCLFKSTFYPKNYFDLDSLRNSPRKPGNIREFRSIK